MARVKLHPELKKAISQLSNKEKDKLLFRLLPKDAALVAQLEFQLLEGGETKEERRNELNEEIDKRLERYQSYYYSPGYLLLELRDISGMINRHVKMTKDKYGEIELNFQLLNTTLTFFGDYLREASAYRCRTLNDYVIKRSLKLLQLLGKLHEDYILDFRPAMEELGIHINQIPSMLKMANHLGLDIESLRNGELPE